MRLVADPTFDEPGPHQSGSIRLEKRIGPAKPASAIGLADAVLLSHDQHADNLDTAGRASLQTATSR